MINIANISVSYPLYIFPECMEKRVKEVKEELSKTKEQAINWMRDDKNIAKNNYISYLLIYGRVFQPRSKRYLLSFWLNRDGFIPDDFEFYQFPCVVNRRIYIEPEDVNNKNKITEIVMGVMEIIEREVVYLMKINPPNKKIKKENGSNFFTLEPSDKVRALKYINGEFESIKAIFLGDIIIKEPK